MRLPGFRSRLALTSSLVSAGEEDAWDGEDLLRWLRENIDKVSLKPLLGILSALAAAKNEKLEFLCFFEFRFRFNANL